MANTCIELHWLTSGYLLCDTSRQLKSKRLPDEDFMFQLTDDEFKNLMFQNGTSSWGGTQESPYVFTEQGVAKFSGILNSDRPMAVIIQVVRIFTRIRQMFVANTEISLEIER